MAIQRSRLFTGGDQGPQDPSSYTVQIDSPADDILKQKDAVLAGWRAKTDKERQYAQERMNALEANYKIEREYHHQAYEFQQADNKLVKNAILKNLEQEFKNIDARAKTHKIKSDAIQDIIGTGAKFAQNQANKQKAKWAEGAKNTAAILGADGDVTKDLPIIEGGLSKDPVIRQNSRATAVKPVSQGGLGWDADTANAVFNAHPTEIKLLQKELARIEADGVMLNSILGVGGVTSQNIIPLVLDNKEVKNVSWSMIRDQALIAPPNQSQELLSIGYNTLRTAIRKEHGDKPEITKRFDSWYTREVLGIKKARIGRAEANSIKNNATIFKSLNSYFLEQDGDPGQAITNTYNWYMDRKGKDVSAKEQGQSLLKWARYNLDGDGMTLDQYQSLRNIKVKHSATGKLVPITDPSIGLDWNEIEAAANRKRARDSKAGSDWSSQQKGLVELATKTYTEEKGHFTLAQHTKEVQNLLTIGTPTSQALAKKVIGMYLKGESSVAHLNQTYWNEVIASRILKNPASVDEEFIRGLTGVTDEWKLDKIEELGLEGHIIPKKVQGIYTKNKDVLIQRLGKLGGQYKVIDGITRFVGDASVELGMLQVGLDFDRKVKTEVIKLSGDKNFEGKSQDYIYREAITRAAAAIKEEIDEGNPGIGKGPGKGKYSFGEGMNSSILPYFMQADSERYHGPTKFLGVREGAQEFGLEAHLINPKTRVVQSDRLEKIAKGEEGMPRIIHEIAKKWNKDESWVLEQLLIAENARRAERKKSKIELPKPSKEEKVLQSNASLYSGILSWPHSREGSQILDIGMSFSTPHDWRQATIGNGLSGYLSDIDPTQFPWFKEATKNVQQEVAAEPTEVELFQEDGVTPLPITRTNEGMARRSEIIKLNKLHLLFGYPDTPEGIEEYEKAKQKNPEFFEVEVTN